MSDNIKWFIDSNILLYLFGDNDRKKNFIKTLANKNYIISTQVVNENVNVCLKKLKLSKAEAFSHGEYLLESFNVVQISNSTIQGAFIICDKYGFSYWDSLIIAAALENKCEILYSEDMQNGQIIEKTLNVVNPWKQFKGLY